MSGRKSLKKGKKGEYEARKLFKKSGFEVINHAEDINLSDISIRGVGSVEIKYQQNAIPKRVYDWLEEKQADILAVKRISKKDRNRDWLMIMSFKTFTKLLNNNT